MGVFNGLFSLDIFLIFILLEIFIFLYTKVWFHVIIILIVLELFILKIYFLVIFFRIKILARSRFLFVFITLRVAEARVGLSLLTLLIRIYGEDIINSNI